MPNAIVTTPANLLLVASGFEDVLRWDGRAASFERAGVVAPTAALTLSGPVEVDPTGAVLDPDTVDLREQIVYIAYQRFVDAHGNFSSLSPVSNELTLTYALEEQLGAAYLDVPIPTDPQVVRRQLLRNTAGQAQTLYVDVDTTDLISSNFLGTLTDTQLQDGADFVALLDDQGVDLADAYNPPPDFKAVLAQHGGRMFAAVDVPYTRGSVALTVGSATVTGIGTEWTSVLPGRFFYVTGATNSYEIASVDVAAQTLTLTAAYTDATDAYASYCIQPAPAYRRQIYFSQADLPEAWKPTDGFALPEDGDEITGLVSKGSFLFILEKRHIYRYTFQSNPATDGFVFLATNRGCVNFRSWVLVDDTAYLLDEQGVHSFGGDTEEDVSEPIKDLWQPDSTSYRINFAASAFFHAAYYPQQQVIRWFVALAGSYLPRHALCYQPKLKRWWIEEYPLPVGSSCRADVQGQPVVFLGGAGKRHWLVRGDPLDMADPGKGTVRGTATSATLTSLSDSAAAFDTTGIIGAPLLIVSGKGKGQQRTIAAATATRLTVSQPWLDLPDTTSVYQVGGILWRVKTGWYRWAHDEADHPRRLELVFLPVGEAATADLRLYFDHADTPENAQADYSAEANSGVQLTAGSPHMVADLTKPSGFVQQRIDGHRETHIDGPRHVAVAVEGVTNEDRIKIHELLIEGAT